MRYKFFLLNIFQMFLMLLLVQWACYLVGFEGVPVILILSVFVFLFLELVGPILMASSESEDEDEG